MTASAGHPSPLVCGCGMWGGGAIGSGSQLRMLIHLLQVHQVSEGVVQSSALLHMYHQAGNNSGELSLYLRQSVQSVRLCHLNALIVFCKLYGTGVVNFWYISSTFYQGKGWFSF